MHFRPATFWIVAATLAAVSSPVAAATRADGQLEIEVIDKKTGQPIPVRMHLKNVRKRPVKLNVSNTAEHGDHFYVDGQLTLPLRRGQYTFEIEATPEYPTQSGHFEIERRADDTKTVEMTRFADMAKEGWYGGDIDFDRPPRDLPLILRAEGLEDVRTGEFAVLLSDDITQSEIQGSTKLTAGDPKSEITIAPTPYAWNLPVWLASGKLDAIQLIHRHSLRDGVVDNEDDGRPRDESLFPGLTGNGRWSAAVYHHVLNCGLRIPPVAGSGSGANESPVGTNRVYVHCGDDFSPESWWQGLVDGRVFVTNGPLLRPMVEGRPPGYVFHLDGDKSLTLEIGLNLATRMPVEYLEIIKDGDVYADVRLAEWKQKKGRLPPVDFDDSGWFLVRAVTSNPKIYQFASSGPYYVEKNGRPRVSRRSVQFFLDWIDAAEAHIRTLPNLEEAKRESLLAEQASARGFFNQVMGSVNAE
jgi:hypothetical protein